MSIRIPCPEGHPVVVELDQLGGTATCPHCAADFPVPIDFLSAEARNEESKSRRSRDDDDDEEERPQKKAKAKDDDLKDKIQELPRKKFPAKKTRANDEDDEDKEEDDRPRKKRPARSKDDEDEDDEDDEEPEDEDENEDETQPIVWTPRKRLLKQVRLALICYHVATMAMLIMFILDSVAGAIAFIMMFIAIFTGDLSIFLLTMGIIAGLMGLGVLVVFVSMFIAWIVGSIFSPKKSEGKSISQLALFLFFLPALYFLGYLVIRFGLISRDDVATNLMNMALGFTALTWIIALYCGLIYIGRIAGFMGRIMDANKPQALGWFIVGGYLARIIGGVAIVIMLVLAAMTGLFSLIIVMGIIAFNWYAYYFVITSLLELLEILNNTRKDVEKYIIEA